MQIDHTKRKQFQITIYDYIHNMMNELQPDMDGGATTPATNNLLSINQIAHKLNLKIAEVFHYNLSRFIYEN